MCQQSSGNGRINERRPESNAKVGFKISTHRAIRLVFAAVAVAVAVTEHGARHALTPAVQRTQHGTVAAAQRARAIQLIRSVGAMLPAVASIPRGDALSIARRGSAGGAARTEERIVFAVAWQIARALVVAVRTLFVAVAQPIARDAHGRIGAL